MNEKELINEKEVMNEKELINEYIKSLDEKELISIDIAKKILEDSFEIEKSIGFKEWIKNKK